MPTSVDRERAASLVRALAMIAVGLGALTGVIYLGWGEGPELPRLPWLNALVIAFVALAGVCGSYACLARFEVLGDAAAFWMGLAFAVFATAGLFYVLVWPGLAPSGGALVPTYPGLVAWVGVLPFLALWLLLQLAARDADGSGSWAHGRSARRALLAVLTTLVAVGALMIFLEMHLPLLVDEAGDFTLLVPVLYSTLVLMFIGGAVFAAHAGRAGGKPLLALSALFQLTLAFLTLWAMLGEQRYGLWWYLNKVGYMLGAVAILFGLLSEHVRVLGREAEANHRLQQEDLRKNRFIATLAHELRNPLATLQAGIAALESDGSAEKLARVLPTMDRQRAQLKSLVDDLLDISRITRDKIALTLEPVDLRTLIQEVAATLPASGSRHLHLHLASEPLVVRGDPVRLRQILINLVDNAVKFTPGSWSNIWISARGYDGIVEVSVRDDGVGISAEALRWIFKPFEQTEEATTGLGIGLTLVHQLASLHGGTVEARSAGKNAGSEFILRLPARASPECTPRVPKPHCASRVRPPVA